MGAGALRGLGLLLLEGLDLGSDAVETARYLSLLRLVQLASLLCALISELLDFGLAHAEVVHFLHDKVFVLNLAVLSQILWLLIVLSLIISVLAGENRGIFCLLACDFHRV